MLQCDRSSAEGESARVSHGTSWLHRKCHVLSAIEKMQVQRSLQQWLWRGGGGSLIIAPLALLLFHHHHTITPNILFNNKTHTHTQIPTSHPPPPPPMSPGLAIWLHGLGDNGPNNAPIKSFFGSPEIQALKWLFPSASSQRVSCNSAINQFMANPKGVHWRAGKRVLRYLKDGMLMPSWFDIFEIPITSAAPNDEEGLMKAVQKVHDMINKAVETGIDANKIFLCGFSQGGALTLASTLLYPKTLAGSAVFSGWVPFNTTFLERATQEGKQTPVLWLHGMDDPTVDFEAGQAGPPLLARVGINCEFKAYPGLGHSITPEELAYLEHWMQAHI